MNQTDFVQLGAQFARRHAHNKVRQERAEARAGARLTALSMTLASATLMMMLLVLG